MQPLSTARDETSNEFESKTDKVKCCEENQKSTSPQCYIDIIREIKTWSPLNNFEQMRILNLHLFLRKRRMYIIYCSKLHWDYNIGVNGTTIILLVVEQFRDTDHMEKSSLK